MPKKVYIDEELCLDWIRSCFLMDGRRRLLVWDSCTLHLPDRVKSSLRQRKIDTVVIPGGMISLLQPLDIAVNRPFKHNTRNIWNEWMMNAQKDYNKAGKIKVPTRQQVVQWTVGPWALIMKKASSTDFASAASKVCCSRYLSLSWPQTSLTAVRTTCSLRTLWVWPDPVIALTMRKGSQLLSLRMRTLKVLWKGKIFEQYIQ